MSDRPPRLILPPEIMDPAALGLLSELDLKLLCQELWQTLDVVVAEIHRRSAGALGKAQAPSRERDA